MSTKNGSSESFQFIYGESPEHVEEKKESSLRLPQVLQNLKFMFNLDLKDISFSPFNRSCIGIHSNQKYTATFKYKSKLVMSNVVLSIWYLTCNYSQTCLKPLYNILSVKSSNYSQTCLKPLLTHGL